MKSYLMNFTMAGLLGSGDDAAKVIQEPVDRINATLETLRNSFEHIDTPILIVCLRTYLQALEAAEHESCIRCADNLQKVIGAMAIRTRKYEKFLVYGPARESAKASPQEGGQPPETSRQRFKAVRHKKRRSR